MRTRAALATAVASVGILLAGWQSGAHIAETGTATTTSLSSSATTGGSAAGGSVAGGSNSSSSGGSSSGSSASAGNSSSGSTTAATYDGASVQTRFGTVQVQVTIQDGKITEVTALQLTDAERKSAQISSRAAPVLRSEVLQAQSANVQTIGGATVTSDAYLSSLQAALDAANF
ncbi:FMN-binding domain-containing protein [Arthrobacter sp. 9V]|uniref:FMN-binding protein n=1 Tax=Arthrobacter sp. 9V TaxID=2653132 RepID=UPI0012F0AA00|nr:FMN-binding protein [Arthrobacter sp. 9V]VXB87645.1 FMN-binding domain-containing protein [Arthrobacter sp. 9V]